MRKALFVGTGGLSGAAGIKANSKKDRTAKAAEQQVRLQKQMLRGSQQTTGAWTRPSAPVRKKYPLWHHAGGWGTVLALFGAMLMTAGTVGAIAVGSVLIALALVLAVVAYRSHPRQQAKRGGKAEPVRAVGAIGVPVGIPRAPAAVGSTVGEIELLADLHRRGALTDEEFAAAKGKVLGTQSPRGDGAYAHLLRKPQP